MKPSGSVSGRVFPSSTASDSPCFMVLVCIHMYSIYFENECSLSSIIGVDCYDIIKKYGLISIYFDLHTS
jgi:hypothetical protein